MKCPGVPDDSIADMVGVLRSIRCGVRVAEGPKDMRPSVKNRVWGRVKMRRMRRQELLLACILGPPMAHPAITQHTILSLIVLANRQWQIYSQKANETRRRPRMPPLEPC